MTQSPEPEVPKDTDQPLRKGLELPRLQVMRSRVLIGLSLGLIGICLGVAGVVFGNAILGLVAAICAVLGCSVIAGETLLPLLQRSEESQQSSATELGSTIVVGPGSTRPAPGPSSASTDDAAGTVIDPITELPDRRYFEVAVEGRVAAARRHLWPVSVVLLQLGFDDEPPAAPRAQALTEFAGIIRKTLREADIACRLNDTTFGLILEDTSEEGGVWTAERLQIALSQNTSSIRRLVAGVAAYPTHGLYAKDVLVRANAALQRASATPVGHGLGQVEVAHVDLS